MIYCYLKDALISKIDLKKNVVEFKSFKIM